MRTSLIACIVSGIKCFDVIIESLSSLYCSAIIPNVLWDFYLSTSRDVTFVLLFGYNVRFEHVFNVTKKINLFYVCADSDFAFQ